MAGTFIFSALKHDVREVCAGGFAGKILNVNPIAAGSGVAQLESRRIKS